MSWLSEWVEDAVESVKSEVKAVSKMNFADVLNKLKPSPEVIGAAAFIPGIGPVIAGGLGAARGVMGTAAKYVAKGQDVISKANAARNMLSPTPRIGQRVIPPASTSARDILRTAVNVVAAQPSVPTALPSVQTGLINPVSAVQAVGVSPEVLAVILQLMGVSYGMDGGFGQFGGVSGVSPSGGRGNQGGVQLQSTDWSWGL